MDPDLYLVDPDRARRSSSVTEASDKTRPSRVDGPREEQQRPRQDLAAAASSCLTWTQGVDHSLVLGGAGTARK